MGNRRAASRHLSVLFLPALAAGTVTAVLGVGTARADHSGEITQFVNQFGASDGLWSNAANWNNHGPPSSTTNPKFAFINVAGSGPAIVATAGQSAVDTFVGQGAGDGALQVTTGGALTLTGDLRLAWDSGRSGTYSQDGGSFTAAKAHFGHQGGTAAATITGGSFTTTGEIRLSDVSSASSATSSLTVTGGTLNAFLIGIGVRSGGTGTGTGSLTIGGDADVNVTQNIFMRAGAANSVTVAGSQATINVNRSSGTGFEVQTNNAVNFDFDSAGISTIDLGTSQMRFSGSGSVLNVDATAFEGEGTFDLFTFGSYFVVTGVPAEFGTENVIFAPGYEGEVLYNSDSIQLAINAIPEPASLGLLVMAGMVVGLRRRRS